MKIKGNDLSLRDICFVVPLSKDSRVNIITISRISSVRVRVRVSISFRFDVHS